MKEFSSRCIFISSLANVITCIKHHAIKSSDYIKILLLLFISSNCSFIYSWKWTSIYKATCNLSIVTDSKWQVELQQQYQTLLNYNITCMATYTSLKVHVFISEIFIENFLQFTNSLKKLNTIIYYNVQVLFMVVFLQSFINSFALLTEIKNSSKM